MSLLAPHGPLPTKPEIKAAFASFSTYTKILLVSLVVLGSLSLLGLVWQFNTKAAVSVAVPGGRLEEGIIGTPRFINPLLAISDADRDVSSLIYSGLMRRSASGELIPDLAERVETSSDGTRFTFYLKRGLTWHDGTPLTSEDIKFTIEKAKDPAIQSPRRANWEGVSIERPDDTTITFVLKQPFAGFLDSATIGILPKHIWETSTAENFAFNTHNTEPIGSGPYRLNRVEYDASGIATAYFLKPFSGFALGSPKVDITIRIYPNETDRLAAYKRGEISAMAAVDPATAGKLKESGTTIKEAGLPRIFAVFFNQNQNPVFAHKEVRVALDAAIDKRSIVSTILLGYGKPLAGPSVNQLDTRTGTGTSFVTTASTILEEAGWRKNAEGIYEKKNGNTTEVLRFTLNTSDTPELKQIAIALANTWRKLGAAVEVKIFDTGTLQQELIRPRKYDALLFGQIVGREPDLFAFWHSSQRLDPGLNIAGYTNTTVDKLLEQARGAVDTTTRRKATDQALVTIMNDAPAVFLYTPSFIYIVPPEVKNLNLGTIQTTGDRFSNIYLAYSHTEYVWRLFANPASILTK